MKMGHVETTISEIGDLGVVCRRTVLSAGGGGQPPDRGLMIHGGSAVEVRGVVASGEKLWHVVEPVPEWATPGTAVRLELDLTFRQTVAAYHTALHILNTIVRLRFDGWITGARIGGDGASIDFSVERLTPEMVAAVETEANQVIGEDRRVRSVAVTEDEYRRRPGLKRTLDVEPPVVDGMVRLVEIVGFDVQACGGDHVESTGELGTLSVVRTENKGRRNKRMYVRLREVEPG
jgi:misacylated tRNA(Ala) deacylase